MFTNKINHKTFQFALSMYMSHHPGLELFEYNYGCVLHFIGHADIKDKNGIPHGRMIVQVGACDGDKELAWNLTHVLADDYGYFSPASLTKCKREFDEFVRNYADCHSHPFCEKYNFKGMKSVADQLSILDGTLKP
jgi:hypothetical protein